MTIWSQTVICRLLPFWHRTGRGTSCLIFLWAPPNFEPTFNYNYLWTIIIFLNNVFVSLPHNLRRLAEGYFHLCCLFQEVFSWKVQCFLLNVEAEFLTFAVLFLDSLQAKLVPVQLVCIWVPSWEPPQWNPIPAHMQSLRRLRRSFDEREGDPFTKGNNRRERQDGSKKKKKTFEKIPQRGEQREEMRRKSHLHHLPCRLLTRAVGSVIKAVK